MFSQDSFDEELSNDEIIQDHKTILNFQNLIKLLDQFQKVFSINTKIYKDNFDSISTQIKRINLLNLNLECQS